MATYALTATKAVSLPQTDGTTRQHESGDVINLVLWDGEAEITLEDGTEMRPVPEGWGVVDGKLVDLASLPLPPAPQTTALTKGQVMAQIQRLTEIVQAMPD